MSWDLWLPAPLQRLRVQLVALSNRKVNEVNARRLMAYRKMFLAITSKRGRLSAVSSLHRHKKLKFARTSCMECEEA